LMPCIHIYTNPTLVHAFGRDKSGLPINYVKVNL
jgi:hypothetical protein